LLPHLSTPEEPALGGLVERTQETTEDINERAEVANQLVDDDSTEEATIESVEEA
jgi:hypothetical protein